MEDTELEIVRSIEFWQRDGKVIGDKCSEIRRRISYNMEMREPKRMIRFWMVGPGIFCGLEVLTLLGGVFDTAKNLAVRIKLTNLRTLKRFLGELGRGVLLLDLAEHQGIEFYAVEIDWLDRWLAENGLSVMPVASIILAAKDGPTFSPVMRIPIEKRPNARWPVVNLPLLVAPDREV